MVNRRHGARFLHIGSRGVWFSVSLALLVGTVSCSSSQSTAPGTTNTATGGVQASNTAAGGSSSNPGAGGSSVSSAGQTSQGTTATGGRSTTGSTSAQTGGAGTSRSSIGGTTASTSKTGTGGSPNAGGTKAAGGTTGNGTASGSGGLTGTVTASSPLGGTSSTSTSTISTTPIPWINEKGIAGTNTLGIQGNWYAFSDKVTSTQTGNPYTSGKYCVTGTAPGDGDSSAHWGVGIGLDLNLVGSDKQAYEYAGKITGFKIKLTGSAPVTPRVQFVDNLDGGVVPFVEAMLGESTVYSITDALIPFEWDVTGAGRGVEGGVLYSLQILIDGGAKEGPIDICIEEFEPIYDPNGNTNTDGPYINRNGYMQAQDNTFGIQGPVYAISDGTSSTQSGNPYKDGKYCIAGTFSGSADNWGAGIAFDLNKLPGSAERSSFAYNAKVGGFRIKLTGNTPGPARIQFVINEPSEGAQPFLAALLNTTMVYRIGWAQVPTSWDVSNKGQEVGSSLYTVQLYLENTEAGPFEVCIEEFTPLGDDELSSAGQAAATGFKGTRTVDEAILEQEWESWKKHRVRDCNDGSACVPREEGDCISEGIGYAMLLAVAFDDRTSFDKFWTYYKNHRIASNQLMNWQTTACGGNIASGTATDGDIDTAFALLQAACKWTGTSYKTDATTLISSIRTNEVEPCNGKLVLRAGAGYGGCSKTNPSYFAPAYYKVFATVSGDTSWNTLATDSYALLSTVQGKMNGLVPNWTDQSGNIPSGDDGKYGPDASRTPWRIATDYVWNGETKAATFLDNVIKYVDSNGGVQRSLSPNSTYRGPLGLSAVHKDATKAKDYADAWLTTSVDDTTYFPGTLRPIYMLLATQKFSKGCY